MEHSVVGNIRRALSLWGQACLVLLKCPLLIFWQVVIACFMTLLSGELGATTHLFFSDIPLLYLFNAFLSHYTMRFIQDQSVRYKKSYAATLVQGAPYILLFIPFILLLFYPPFYGKQLFFAAVGSGKSAQVMNVLAARILFSLLVLSFAFLFVLVHIALVIHSAEKISFKQMMKRAFNFAHNNFVIVISLTCLFFAHCFLFLFLLKYTHQVTDLGHNVLQAIGLLALNGIQLVLPYYVITASLNLYCIALTILYYDRYVKRERVLE